MGKTINKEKERLSLVKVAHLSVSCTNTFVLTKSGRLLMLVWKKENLLYMLFCFANYV